MVPNVQIAHRLFFITFVVSYLDVHSLTSPDLLGIFTHKILDYLIIFEQMGMSPLILIFVLVASRCRPVQLRALNDETDDEHV